VPSIKKQIWLSISAKLKRQVNERRKTEITMPQAKQIARPSPYASSADFRQIFDEDMNGLYLLSFLLTADREKAEECFVSGLEDAVDGNPVFKEWARSWARRAIIQNAVRAINPRPAEDSRSSPASVDSRSKMPPAEQPLEIAAVLALEPFERFVYVITVLERYSDQDCSVLLGCSRRDVLAARTRAFQQLASQQPAPQQIGRAREMQYNPPPNASSNNSERHERRSSVFELPLAPRLVTSA
jgi:DNA-directed RNA polymerase specialized sigma24 family protein